MEVAAKAWEWLFLEPPGQLYEYDYSTSTTLPRIRRPETSPQGPIAQSGCSEGAWKLKFGILIGGKLNYRDPISLAGSPEIQPKKPIHAPRSTNGRSREGSPAGPLSLLHALPSGGTSPARELHEHDMNHPPLGTEEQDPPAPKSKEMQGARRSVRYHPDGKCLPRLLGKSAAVAGDASRRAKVRGPSGTTPPRRKSSEARLHASGIALGISERQSQRRSVRKEPESKQIVKSVVSLMYMRPSNFVMGAVSKSVVRW